MAAGGAPAPLPSFSSRSTAARTSCHGPPRREMPIKEGLVARGEVAYSEHTGRSGDVRQLRGEADAQVVQRAPCIRIIESARGTVFHLLMN